MQPETRKLLTDMAEAADAVTEFVAGKMLADFLGDKPILRRELITLLSE